MPRPRNPGNEQGRAAQERYRDNLRIRGGAETDAVDSALSAALAVFRDISVKSGQQRNLDRLEGIEKMAANLLVARGGRMKEVLRAVRLRTRREDVEELLPLVGSSADPSARP